ncbi:unnamed protein product [Prorocentrum cordatum]|uniref:Uncharacterized protein n=1 Tax=Prorocentrum cordatum TaxID=2364126 RepID=A0ABN9S544_9DINO|nr:unnamed protein product [Polarella glacialis]
MRSSVSSALARRRAAGGLLPWRRLLRPPCARARAALATSSAAATPFLSSSGRPPKLPGRLSGRSGWTTAPRSDPPVPVVVHGSGPAQNLLVHYGLAFPVPLQPHVYRAAASWRSSDAKEMAAWWPDREMPNAN